MGVRISLGEDLGGNFGAGGWVRISLGKDIWVAVLGLVGEDIAG